MQANTDDLLEAQISLNIPNGGTIEIDVSNVYEFVKRKGKKQTTERSKFLDQFSEIVEAAISNSSSLDNERKLRCVNAVYGRHFSVSYYNRVSGSAILLTPRNAKRYFEECINDSVPPRLTINFRASSISMPSNSPEAIELNRRILESSLTQPKQQNQFVHAGGASSGTLHKTPTPAPALQHEELNAKDFDNEPISRGNRGYSYESKRKVPQKKKIAPFQAKVEESIDSINSQKEESGNSSGHSSTKPRSDRTERFGNTSKSKGKNKNMIQSHAVSNNHQSQVKSHQKYFSQSDMEEESHSSGRQKKYPSTKVQTTTTTALDDQDIELYGKRKKANSRKEEQKNNNTEECKAEFLPLEKSDHFTQPEELQADTSKTKRNNNEKDIKRISAQQAAKYFVTIPAPKPKEKQHVVSNPTAKRKENQTLQYFTSTPSSKREENLSSKNPYNNPTSDEMIQNDDEAKLMNTQSSISNKSTLSNNDDSLYHRASSIMTGASSVDDFDTSTIYESSAGFDSGGLFYAFDSALLHLLKLWKSHDAVTRYFGVHEHSYTADLSRRLSRRGITLNVITDKSWKNDRSNDDLSCDAAALIFDEENIDVTSRAKDYIKDAILPGGYLFLFLFGKESEDVNFSRFDISLDIWNNPKLIFSEDYVTVLCVPKRPCLLNTSVSKWKFENESNPNGISNSDIDYEYQVATDVTITLPAKEVRKTQPNYQRNLSGHMVKKAIRALDMYGFVIIKSLYARYVNEFGEAATADCQEALDILNYNRNDNTNNEEKMELDAINYREISIKDTHINIRDGRKLRTIESEWKSFYLQQESIKDIVTGVFHNNLESLESQQTGFLISLPQSSCEAIHSDETHLFSMDAPPHSISMFVMSGENEQNNKDLSHYYGGQQAFVAGSHLFSRFKYFTSRKGDNGVSSSSWNETCSNIIRPLLAAGDAVLYDSRIMRYGVENTSEDKLSTPCLYVVWKQSWFASARVKSIERMDSLLQNLDRIYFSTSEAACEFLEQKWSTHPTIKIPTSKRVFGLLPNNAIAEDLILSLENRGIVAESLQQYKPNSFDAAAIFILQKSYKNLQEAKIIEDSVVPGGILLLFIQHEQQFQRKQSSSRKKYNVNDFGFSAAIWGEDEVIFSGEEINIYGMVKRPCQIDFTSRQKDMSLSRSMSVENLRYEYQILNDITVTTPAEEYRKLSGQFSPESLQKAVNALLMHGVCILRNFFPKNRIIEYSSAASSDLRQIENKGLAGTRIEMDDGLYEQRLELEGRRLSHIQDARGDEWINRNRNLLDILTNTMSPSPKSTSFVKTENKRGHSVIQLGLDELIFDEDPSSILKRGKTEITVNFPDCLGEEFYSTANHILGANYDCLPPHYLRLLLPTAQNVLSAKENISSSNGIGSDAISFGNVFIVGSHTLSINKRINEGSRDSNDQDGANEKFRRTIRPSLEAGDALLFDCRILRTDLPNSSVDGSVWNPIIHVDWMRNWFHIPAHASSS